LDKREDFVGLSQSEFNDLRSSALSQSTSGRRTALSGGQKSGSKEWTMSADEILREVIYAEQQSGARAPRITKTYGSFTGIPPFPVVNGEQV